MLTKPGEKLPILGIFTKDSEPIVVSDTPLITIECKDLDLGVWSTVVSAQQCTKYADGRVDYSYAAGSGNLQYYIKIITTDETVDAQQIVQELFSGGLWNELSTLRTKVDALSDAGALSSSSSISKNNELHLTRGDRISQAITGVSDDILSADKIWLTIKYDRSQPDAKSVVQIEKTAGLVYLNGVEVEDGDDNAGIEPTDDGDGTATVTFTLEAEASADLPIKTCWWDLQYLVDTNVTTPRQGRCIIEGDVTHAVS